MKKLLKLCGEGISLFVATALLITAVVVHGFATWSVGNGYLGFANHSRDISDRYYTEMTPAYWLTSGWGVVYMWQALWLVYGWSFLFRPQAKRTIPTGTYWLFSLSCLLTVPWLYLTGNHYIAGALPFVILVPAALILAQSLVVWRTYRTTFALQATNAVDLWATRVLVHNGVATLTAWFSVQWILHAVMVATEYGVDATWATAVGLVVLLIELVVWFDLEHSILDRFVRYIHSEYLVVMVMLAAIIIEHWNNDNEVLINHILEVFLLCFVLVLQACRVGLVLAYSRWKKIDFPFYE